MIVVTVELWRKGYENDKVKLGEMRIENVGGSKEVGEYDGRTYRKPGFGSVTRQAHVDGHRRLALPVWTLVRKMLEAMKY